MIIRAKRLNFEQIPLRKKGNRDRGIPIVQILDRDINLSLPKPNSKIRVHREPRLIQTRNQTWLERPTGLVKRSNYSITGDNDPQHWKRD